MATRVEKKVERIIRRVAEDPPSVPEMPSITSLRLGSQELADWIVSASASGRRMQFHLVGDPSRLWQIRELEFFSLKGRTAEGRRLEIETAHTTELDFSVAQNAARLTIEALDWVVEERRSRGRFWALELKLPRGVPWGPGNLSVCSPRSVSYGHYALFGRNSYFLVRPLRARRRVWVVVDTHSAGLDRQQCFEDLLIIQYLLGFPVESDLILQLNAQGEAVGAASFGLGTGVKPTIQPWAPIDWDKSGMWAAEFFFRIDRFRQARSRLGLLVPMNLLVDTAAANFDTRYLAAYVALEGATSWLPQGNAPAVGRHLLVTDRPRWNRWVRTNRQQIEQHARAGQQHALVDRVRAAAQRDQGAMQRNFVAAGLPWLKKMEDAVRTRNHVVHYGRMRSRARGLGGWRKDFERQGLVWTMLAMVLARAIGYDGPIVDQRRAFGSEWDARPPTWWTFTRRPPSSSLAAKVFQAGPRPRLRKSK